MGNINFFGIVHLYQEAFQKEANIKKYKKLM